MAHKTLCYKQTTIIVIYYYFPGRPLEYGALDIVLSLVEREGVFFQ